MLYYLFQYLDQTMHVSGTGVFQYITFRSALAFILSLLLSTIYGKNYSFSAKSIEVGETVRELGLEGQNEKQIPTMEVLLSYLRRTGIIICKIAKYIYRFLIVTTFGWGQRLDLADDYQNFQK
jgi:phospho-N-acetylmuramoyl-pentapeptide-transferase